MVDAGLALARKEGEQACERQGKQCGGGGAVSRQRGQEPDGRQHVRFRFTAQGSASWQIDDVYVDPRMR